MKRCYSLTLPTVSPAMKNFCRNGYKHMIGTEATMVIAALMDKGVTMFWLVCELAPTPAAMAGLLLAFNVEDSSFISSY